MSASREKQSRQAVTGQTDPKTARAAQQRKEEKRSSLLYGVIAAAVVVAVIVSAVWRSDLLTKTKTAAIIDGEKYTTGEVGYFYQTAYRNLLSDSYFSYFASYLGLNTSASLKGQVISEDAASFLGLELSEDGESMTWHDYFLDEALNNMKVIQATLKHADAEGFQYPASVQAQYDVNMNALKSAAAAGGISVSQYLKGNFGSGVTEKVYGEQLMRMLKYSAYATAYEDSLTYSESQLEESYNADKNAFDLVSYEIVSFSGEAQETYDDDGNPVEPTEVESAAALVIAQSNAKSVLEGYQAGGSLEDLAAEYDGTYNNNESGTYSANSVTGEWLYDSARKDGDSAVLEDGSIEYVVVFHSRSRDESPTIDVRHILITPEAGTLSEEDAGYDEEQAQLKAAAHTKAEEILAQWKSGPATEESFGELALAESADGSKYSGGLYTEVYQGQMVTEFNDWCFDPSRQAGDTGVVDTTYGAHVMYFSGVDLPRWQTQVADVLRNQDYADWENGLVENVTVQRDESGLNLIG